MKPGSMVTWKHRYNLDLPGEIGIILEKSTPPHEFFPYWKVVFPDRGILQCRESDLMEVP